MRKDQAEQLLQQAVADPNVRFRPGQWEAIDALVNQRAKLLLVQRTGWGKSSVYFITTRILRDQGAGPTLIVSPLLALMRNQIDAANRLQIHAVTINSTNQDEWEDVKNRIFRDEVDALLISPERLSNQNFLDNMLRPIADRTGMLVVDEAHCISDWGHDFRPDYRRLLNVLRQMPPNLPILGTTATANDRVIADVERQLGDIQIQRGPLARRSLSLQTLRLADQAERLAWLAQRIPELPGTGIVYVLTQRDAEQVSEWLLSRGIAAAAYHSSVIGAGHLDSNSCRQFLEDQLLNNKIKALVATSALGMGYDKPDLGFVIHYQAPSSVIAYYQQVGRAGRAIDEAFGVLLAGYEDDDIQAYFRDTAFPPEKDVREILEALEDSDGMSRVELQERLNLRAGQIDKALKILSVEDPAPIIKMDSQWRRTAVAFQMDRERIERLTKQRELEWREIQEYIDTESCLMAYLLRALDDSDVDACGACANCLGQPVVSAKVAPAQGEKWEIPAHTVIQSPRSGLFGVKWPDGGWMVDTGGKVRTFPTKKALARHMQQQADVLNAAKRFLRHSEFPFTPKKQIPRGAFPEYGLSGNLLPTRMASEGRILSRWGDAGWGALVKEGKGAGRFPDELVDALAEMLEQRWRPDPPPGWIACVPSLNNPDLVPSFAERLAKRLELPFAPVIRKVRANEPQKTQQNKFHQCRNLDGVFELAQPVPDAPVLLVDDIIDSGWTVTVLAALLRDAGAGDVYPIALASTKPGA